MIKNLLHKNIKVQNKSENKISSCFKKTFLMLKEGAMNY